MPSSQNFPPRPAAQDAPDASWWIGSYVRVAKLAPYWPGTTPEAVARPKAGPARPPGHNAFAEASVRSGSYGLSSSTAAPSDGGVSPAPSPRDPAQDRAAHALDGKAAASLDPNEWSARSGWAPQEIRAWAQWRGAGTAALDRLRFPDSRPAGVDASSPAAAASFAGRDAAARRQGISVLEGEARGRLELQEIEGWTALREAELAARFPAQRVAPRQRTPLEAEAMAVLPVPMVPPRRGSAPAGDRKPAFLPVPPVPPPPRFGYAAHDAPDSPTSLRGRNSPDPHVAPRPLPAGTDWRPIASESRTPKTPGTGFTARIEPLPGPDQLTARPTVPHPNAAPKEPHMITRPDSPTSSPSSAAAAYARAAAHPADAWLQHSGYATVSGAAQEREAAAAQAPAAWYAAANPYAAYANARLPNATVNWTSCAPTTAALSAEGGSPPPTPEGSPRDAVGASPGVPRADDFHSRVEQARSRPIRQSTTPSILRPSHWGDAEFAAVDGATRHGASAHSRRVEPGAGLPPWEFDSHAPHGVSYVSSGWRTPSLPEAAPGHGLALTAPGPLTSLAALAAEPSGTVMPSSFAGSSLPGKAGSRANSLQMGR